MWEAIAAVVLGVANAYSKSKAAPSAASAMPGAQASNAGPGSTTGGDGWVVSFNGNATGGAIDKSQSAGATVPVVTPTAVTAATQAAQASASSSFLNDPMLMVGGVVLLALVIAKRKA